MVCSNTTLSIIWASLKPHLRAGTAARRPRFGCWYGGGFQRRLAKHEEELLKIFHHLLDLLKE